MEPALTLKQVCKRFGPVEIIRDAELQVKQGERHALIGPNGAGKSTLFNLISGRFAPTSGQIYLGGRRISGMPPEKINRLGLSRSFQITSIFPRLSALENMRIAVMSRHGIEYSVRRPLESYRAISDRASAILDDVRLTHKQHLPAGQLAYSEQRALEIALTLATDPDVILLDEPTSGMSRQESEHMVELIRRVTIGKTLLVVEHDMSVVFRLCDRISVLVYGSIIASGPPETIREDQAVRAAYLGAPQNHA